MAVGGEDGSGECVAAPAKHIAHAQTMPNAQPLKKVGSPLVGAAFALQRSAALPVALETAFGLFQPVERQDARDAQSSAVKFNASPHSGAKSMAVLFLPPWGFEEMCSHKLYRLMAEMLADQGIASLRFDYPGTGDAIDGKNPSELTLQDWKQAIIYACERLKTFSGTEHIALIGHGLGASLALSLVAEGALCPAGLVAMAPVAQGRSYLRELQFWSRVIDDGLGLPEDLRSRAAGAIASHIMPPAIAEALKSSDFLKKTAEIQAATSAPLLFLCRPDRPTDQAFVEAAAQAGLAVEALPYHGYDALVANPAMAKMPVMTAETLVEWLVARAPDAQFTPPDAVLDQQAALQGPGFCETALRFGRDFRLYGILCAPIGARQGATVILMNTAYDRASGWGRHMAALARDLARQGIASFRFDPANIGDSPPVPGQNAQVLYAESQLQDVEAALACLEGLGHRQFVAAGRCSGGYLAFRAQLAFAQIKASCLLNPFVFYWDEARNVEETLTFIPRSVETYRQRLVQVETLKRLWRGEVDVVNAMRNMSFAFWQRFLRRSGLNHYLRAAARKQHGKVRSAFATLLARKAKVELIYSAHDVGLEHFYQEFGEDGAGLKRYVNVNFTCLEGVDHNFTPQFARDYYRDRLVMLAKSIVTE